ncbi:CPBP family glutamic-type intramembrane protease [Micromonospora ureilytica]|nr:CPBP family glutamic-type intramembrane protease [Micromonospora ureilytica]WSR55885.1 CPBP family glutamic-type intramembrane protease [Micromonospora ureilytica]
MLAFAFALWAQGGPSRAVAALVVVETALLCLPWRLPRIHRSGRSFWVETLCGLVAPGGALIVLVVAQRNLLTQLADWWWFVAAAGVGGVFWLVSGLDIRAVPSGMLAFLMGPTPRSQGRARAVCAAAGPFGEEALFRSVVLTTASAAATPMGLLSAVAFVARHHVSPGSNGRGTTRATLTEIAAAVLLLVLTVLSQSLFPALLAHLINNLPGVIIELQREDTGKLDAS